MDEQNLTLDESITADELNDALGDSPQPFQDVELQDDASTFSLTDLRIAPNKPREAIAVARHYHESNRFVGAGLCLKTVHEYFEVPALWPDAASAWDHSGPRHQTSDPMAIPRGGVVYWLNGRHGHVALSVGGGLCWTTDYRRTGFVGLAPISALGAWCGGHLVGWGETLNGYDAWPANNKPPTPPWGLTDKRRFVAHALHEARAEHAGQRKIDGLVKWLAAIDERLKGAK